MTPYYVQRGHIKVWDEKSTNKDISDFADLDYMGSFEFECGAYAKSILTSKNNKNKYEFFKTDIKNKSGKTFYIYCPKEYYQDVVSFILKAIDGKRIGKLTKERTDLYESFTEPAYIVNDSYYFIRAKQLGFESPFTNYWWDIENNFGVILGTEQDFKHFKEAISNIYKYYDKKYPIEDGISK